MAATKTMAGTREDLGHSIVADDPDYTLRMSWTVLSRSTSGLLDWVDRLGPNVTLDKRTVANTRTGWMLSQNTLRKARANEAESQRRIGWIFNLVCRLLLEKKKPIRLTLEHSFCPPPLTR